MQKKAQLSIQFNWIFVLIVGGMILSLFVSMGISYWKVSEKKAAEDITSKMQSLFLQSKASSTTANFVEISKLEILYTCEDECNGAGCPSSFVVGQGSPIEAEVLPIFAPAAITGNELVAWSQDWVVPFRVDSFLYLTTPEIAYVFIDDPSKTMKEELFDELPPDEIIFRGQRKRGMSKFNASVSGTSALPSFDGYQSVVVIGFGSSLSLGSNQLNGVDKKDVRGLLITPEGGVFGSGTLAFCTYNGVAFSCRDQQLQTSYVGKASLMGAIFSDSKEMYECNMKKALLRYGNVASIYGVRAAEINAHYAPTSPACAQVFADGESSLLAVVLSVNVDNINQPAQNLLGSVKSTAGSLINFERNAQLQSCEDVY